MLTDLTNLINIMDAPYNAACDASYTDSTPAVWMNSTGTPATDDTAAIQAAINAAPPNATIIIPGKARITSTLTITNSVNIIGLGRGISQICNDGTSHVAVKLSGGNRGSFVDIGILGNDVGPQAPTATTGDGILCDSVVIWDFVRCWVAGHGGNGVNFTDTSSSNVYFSESEFEYNKIDGIRCISNNSGVQKNGVAIRDCHLAQNGGNGATLWGNSFVCNDNIIEGNEGWGVAVSSEYLTGKYACSLISIKNNYFELDQTGFIKVQSNTSQNATGIKIVDNYGIMNGSQANSSCTALVLMKGLNGSYVNATYSGNAFGSDTLLYADFGNALNVGSVIHYDCNVMSDTAKYVNIGSARVMGIADGGGNCLVLNGLFNAKGNITFSTVTESDDMHSLANGSKTCYFALPFKTNEKIFNLGLYVDTDSTNYNVTFNVQSRSSQRVSVFTNVITPYSNSNSGAKYVMVAVDYFANIFPLQLNTEYVVQVAIVDNSNATTTMKIGSLNVLYN